jgi:branched-chain amino acid transport system substrate-binding protein
MRHAGTKLRSIEAPQNSLHANRSRGTRGSILLRSLSLLLLVALILSACGGGSQPNQGGGEKEVVGGPGSEASGKPIKVGFLLDKTGALASYGYAHERVGEAAVEYINSHGGVDGRPIQLIEVDTESDPSIATPKARNLVQSDNVDFLMGSNTSAIVLAVAPIAEELDTVYFPTAGGALLTEPGKGNRYVFDFNTNVKQETQGVVNYITADLPNADKWATVVVDYSWGWDNENSFNKYASEKGLDVVSQTRVPLGTGDWLSNLQGNLSDQAEGVYFANFGTDFLSFMQALQTMEPDVEKIGANYVLSGQDIAGLGEGAEGMKVIAGYPPYCTSQMSKFDEQYREIVGMNCEGRAEDSGDDMVASYSWSTWETLWAIKEVVERSGWKSQADTQKFIETLENYEFKESLAHPEGAKHFRPEDHLSIKGAWLEEVRDGELVLVTRIDPQAMVYPPVVNYQANKPK